MGLKVAGTLGKVILIVINAIFMVLGLGSIAIGAIMRINSDELYTDEIIATLNEVSLTSQLRLGDLIRGLSIYVIIIGVFILLVSTIGALGACFQNKPLLIIYAVVVGLLFIGEIVAVILWITMKDKFEDTVREELYAALANYDGVDATEDRSVGVDLLQLDLKCCGSNDISTTANDEEFKNSKWYKNKRANSNQKVPPSCCKNANKKNYKTYSDAACQEALTDHNDKGCSKALKEETDSYQISAICVGVVTLVIEVVAFVFTVLLLLAIGKDKMIV